ncbi:hypothetical protein FEM48_Zijuj01G0216400 [Ziziphus jujuba var. spinosa]|uniref:Uncharacterized protein n=1 Tax=Ziziphus jujuba var. spinosa TaxID=714518 RepID=A0A978W3Q0_ZIZJJ|nr:hypothetical protein FEM48_Zijuj01G0216400 [Ziziphus jujuba var. spinosa]
MTTPIFDLHAYNALSLVPNRTTHNLQLVKTLSSLFFLCIFIPDPANIVRPWVVTAARMQERRNKWKERNLVLRSISGISRIIGNGFPSGWIEGSLLEIVYFYNLEVNVMSIVAPISTEGMAPGMAFNTLGLKIGMCSHQCQETIVTGMACVAPIETMSFGKPLFANVSRVSSQKETSWTGLKDV